MKIEVDKETKFLIFKCDSIGEIKWILERFIFAMQFQYNEAIESIANEETKN